MQWYSVWFSDELLGKYQAHTPKEACECWLGAHPNYLSYSVEKLVALLDAFPCDAPDERD